VWLLSVDNDAHQLLWIRTATGQGVPVCDLATEDRYPSITFSRDGRLFAFNNTLDRLDEIDPCSCAITPIGDVGYASSIVGITTDQGVGLFGVEKDADTLVTLNTVTGEATVIGGLGTDFGSSGATWVDELGGMYAINSLDDSLYTVEPSNGVASHEAHLTANFTFVGIEYHPGEEVLYACTQSTLYSIDTTTGIAWTVGTINSNSCNNLAAPYTFVECPDWPTP
jgi:hypothetical protein